MLQRLGSSALGSSLGVESVDVSSFRLCVDEIPRDDCTPSR